ncbi:hypothetical protein ABZ372_37550, partial [Streptomyces sp. NPDC005921]
MKDLPPVARFGGRVMTGLLDVTSDPAALDSQGMWAVVAGFEGRLTCARFRDVRPLPRRAVPATRWNGTGRAEWSTSLDRAAYTAGVRRIREHIAAGEVYQANLCRVLSARQVVAPRLRVLEDVLRVGGDRDLRAPRGVRRRGRRA